MIEHFFDTSALQHRYVSGSYSRRVRTLLGRSTSRARIAETTVLELPSALATRCRANGWGLKKFDHLHAQFWDDLASDTLSVRAVGMREVKRAIHLIRFSGVANKRALKSSDALIAACAVEHALDIKQVVNFYTSDRALFFALRDLNVFRTAMNLHLLGNTKDGSLPYCRVLSNRD